MRSKAERTGIAVVLALMLLTAIASIAPGAPLKTAFTYQGEISQGGTPLSGPADFQFSLYDTLLGGTRVGAVLSINNVTVTSGVFAALLDFGVNAFNGEARYLEIALRAPAGGGVFTTLSPRVTVTPTPYALQTRGIFVDSLENVVIGSPPTSTPSPGMRSLAAGGNSKLKVTASGEGDVGVDAEATATTGQSDGVHGKSASSQGRGVLGEVTATTGDTKGMHGRSDSDQGTGVFGEAAAASGATKGMHGKSASSNGIGVLGEADAASGDTKGVHGTSASNAGTGMMGEATAASGATKGMHGKSDSDQGTGVFGEASAATGDGKGMHGKSASTAGTGMLGEATATTGATKGMHGKSDSDQGTGVFGEASAATGDGKGMHGKSASTAGTGMMGEATATTGDAKGMHGMSASDAGTGILGEATATSGSAVGVHGKSVAATGIGVVGEAAAGGGTAILGVATDSTGSNIGIHGKTNSPTGFAGFFEGRTYVSDRIGVGTQTPTAKLDIAGVPGTDGIRFPDGTLQTSATPAGASSWQPNGSDIYYNNGNVGVGTTTPSAMIQGATATASGTAVFGSATGTGATIGVRGTSSAGTGMKGEATAATGATNGMYGASASTSGTGILGEATATSGSTMGVRGKSASSTGTGILGEATATTGVNFGVYGRTSSPTGYAGYFEGRGYVSGRLGVGTSAPTAMLHIAGVAGTDGIRFPDGTLQTTALPPGSSQWVANGSDTYYNLGSVGVGTATPMAKIDAVQASGIAIQGATAGAGGTAVSGSATGTGATIGVKGTSSSGDGVQGTGTTGVRGTSSTSAGRAVLGSATGTGAAIGVLGTSASSTGEGVEGSGATGVRGISSVPAGKGVLAEASAGDGTALSAVAAHTTGVNIGVRGKTNSPNGFAGYFEGRCYVGGWLGVGTIAPTAMLHIAGVPGMDGIRFPDGTLQTTALSGSSRWVDSGPDVYFNNTGNVGVGTLTPAAKIDAVQFNGNAIQGATSGTNGTGVYGSATGDWGIGVRGSCIAGTGILGEATAETGITTGIRGASASTSGTGIMGDATASTGINFGVYGRTNSPGGYAAYFEGRGYVSGQLGVGTSAPTAMLHIGGVPGTDGIRFPDGTLQTTALPPGGSQWVTNSPNIYFNSGNIGVGTTTPTAKIDAVQTSGIAIQGVTAGAGATAVYGSATGTGYTVGVLGSGDQGVKGTSANLQGIGVFGTTTGGGGIGVLGNSSSHFGMWGAGYHGVRGEAGGSDGIGVWGGAGGIGANRGVYGWSQSPSPDAAGVLAEGSGVGAPGTPKASALEVRNGAIVVNGTNRPAGTFQFDAGTASWTAIASCNNTAGPTTHSHAIGWGTEVTLLNPLLKTDSILLLTVQIASGAPLAAYGAYVKSIGTSGSALIEVTRVGVDTPATCAIPTGLVKLHYLVVNPGSVN